ncbi:hypothetical protein P5673_028300, partial [Acropora cervicornis]
MWVTWLPLIDAFENDVNSTNASGLRLLHKLTADHIFLNPYLRMRVYLTVQVFSNRVPHAITEQESTHNLSVKVCTQLDGRLQWLEDDFLKYFQDWKDWAVGQEDVPLAE